MTLTDAQKATRRTGIGASEIGALLGMDPYKSAIDIYLRILGLADEQAESHHIKRGVYLEPALREWASNETRMQFDPPSPRTLRHPRHQRVLASPDGVAIDSNGRLVCLELKAPGPHTLHEWGEGDDAPDRYVMQLHQQMCVWNAASGILAGLVGGELRIYRYERDTEIDAAIISTINDWWVRHIDGGEMPEPDGSRSYGEYLSGKWSKTRGEIIRADGATEDLLAEYRAARAMRESAEAQEELCKQRLQSVIGDADGIESPVVGKVYWRRSKDRVSTDWKAVAQELSAPTAIVEKHTTTKPGPRVFRPYFAKERK